MKVLSVGQTMGKGEGWPMGLKGPGRDTAGGCVTIVLRVRFLFTLTSSTASRSEHALRESEPERPQRFDANGTLRTMTMSLALSCDQKP